MEGQEGGVIARDIGLDKQECGVDGRLGGNMFLGKKSVSLAVSVSLTRFSQHR